MDTVHRNSLGGGIALVYGPGFDCQRIASVTKKTFEHGHWTLFHKSKHLDIHIFYCPPGRPGQSIQSFIEEFTAYLETALTNTNPVFIGDFNIHTNDPEDTDAVDFNTTLSALGLDQHVNFYTHNKGNTLDLIISPHLMQLSILRTIPDPFFSDHRAVITTVGMVKPKFPREQVKYRKLHCIDIDQFCCILEAMLSYLDISSTPLDQLAIQFHSVLTTLLDVHTPQ